MTTVQLTLTISDGLARAAKEAGLLEPAAVERLLREAVDRNEPISLDEIQAEANAVRRERKAGDVKSSGWDEYFNFVRSLDIPDDDFPYRDNGPPQERNLFD